MGETFYFWWIVDDDDVAELLGQQYALVYRERWDFSFVYIGVWVDGLAFSDGRRSFWVANDL